MIFVQLIAMIVLGVLSAALSHYRKNYYLRVFDDIIGREEDDRATVKLGRAFIYGFLFPVYFSLALLALIALVVFLVVGGIIAGIIFALVWITERILPHSWFGELMLVVFQKLGFGGTPQQAASADVSPASVPPPAVEVGVPGDEPRQEPKDDSANAFPGGGINRTRVHKLD